MGTCERTYETGRCTGFIIPQKDGTLECSDCFALCQQLVSRDGQLEVVHNAIPGDKLLAFENQLPGLN